MSPNNQVLCISMGAHRGGGGKRGQNGGTCPPPPLEIQKYWGPHKDNLMRKKIFFF